MPSLLLLCCSFFADGWQLMQISDRCFQMGSTSDPRPRKPLCPPQLSPARTPEAAQPDPTIVASVVVYTEQKLTRKFNIVIKCYCPHMGDW